MGVFRLFDEQHVTGTLDFLGEFAMHLGSHACDAAGQDTALFGQEFFEQFGVFEVDGFAIDIDTALRQGAQRAATGPHGFGNGGHN